jgi:hypothetical protein
MQNSTTQLPPGCNRHCSCCFSREVQRIPDHLDQAGAERDQKFILLAVSTLLATISPEKLAVVAEKAGLPVNNNNGGAWYIESARNIATKTKTTADLETLQRQPPQPTTLTPCNPTASSSSYSQATAANPNPTQKHANSTQGRNPPPRQGHRPAPKQQKRDQRPPSPAAAATAATPGGRLADSGSPRPSKGPPAQLRPKKTTLVPFQRPGPRNL